MTESKPDCREKPGRGRWIGPLLAVGYLGVLVGLGMVGRRPHWGQEAISLALLHWREPSVWIGAAVLGGLLEFGKFAVLGWLMSLYWGQPTKSRAGMARIARGLWGLLVGFGLVALVSAAACGHFVGVVFLGPALVGYALGARVAVTWSRGLRATARLAAALAALLAASAVAACLLFALAFQSEPLAIEAPEFTPSEKHQLTETLKQVHNEPGDVHALRLSEKEVDLLVSGGTSFGLEDGRAEVELHQGSVSARLSLRTPFGWPNSRYLNLVGKLELEIEGGRIRLAPERLRVGRLWVPNFLIRSCLPAVIDAMRRDPDLGQAIAAIESVRIEPDSVEIVYHSDRIDRATVSSLLSRLTETPAATEVTRIYYLRLVEAADALPPVETLPEANRRFQELVRIAFMLAERRSQVEDPVQENRAALLALAILLGHERVESLVGRVTDSELRAAARRSVGRVALWDRRDLLRHFLVSAALTSLANEKASDRAGLFKEEIDSVRGGSGFSFADLLADRAGSRLATVATRNEISARGTQVRLSSNFSIHDLCPPPTDLPEGISEEDLSAYYGGVGGANFQRIEQEIKGRLETCDALR